MNLLNEFFEMKTMKDYYNFYLKCEVLLSAYVSQKFSNNDLNNYGLYPCHDLRAAACWDAVFNMTNIELELTPDGHMFIFFEKGIKDRVSYICNRCSKVSNRYLKSSDPKQESKHVLYLDPNNWYGYPMPKFFPSSAFKWIDPKEVDLNKCNSYG